jgi:hypothetical protein
MAWCQKAAVLVRAVVALKTVAAAVEELSLVAPVLALRVRTAAQAALGMDLLDLLAVAAVVHLRLERISSKTLAAAMVKQALAALALRHPSAELLRNMLAVVVADQAVAVTRKLQMACSAAVTAARRLVATRQRAGQTQAAAVVDRQKESALLEAAALSFFVTPLVRVAALCLLLQGCAIRQMDTVVECNRETWRFMNYVVYESTKCEGEKDEKDTGGVRVGGSNRVQQPSPP